MLTSRQYLFENGHEYNNKYDLTHVKDTKELNISESAKELLLFGNSNVELIRC